MVEAARGVLDVEWNEKIEDFFAEKKIYLRYPWTIKNVFKYGEKVRIPRRVSVEPYTNMPPRLFASLGAFSYCRSTLVVSAVANDFRTGRYCSIAPLVKLSDQEHPLDRVSTHVFTFREHTANLAKKEFGKEVKPYPANLLKSAPDIGHDVWLGRDCIIKRGITIGHGAVVAERSIVTKDVPPYAIVAGTPAKIVRFRFDEKTIERLLELQWWKYNYADFSNLDSRNIDGFIDGLSEMIQRKEIFEFNPKRIKIAEELESFLEINA